MYLNGIKWISFCYDEDGLGIACLTKPKIQARRFQPVSPDREDKNFSASNITLTRAYILQGGVDFE
jgi:hypothetical protein